jgi:hypothetical protein
MLAELWCLVDPMVLLRRSSDSESAAGGEGAEGWGRGCAPKEFEEGPRGWRMGATGSEVMRYALWVVMLVVSGYAETKTRRRQEDVFRQNRVRKER